MTEFTAEDVFRLANAIGLEVEESQAPLIASRLTGVAAEMNDAPDGALSRTEPAHIFSVAPPTAESADAPASPTTTPATPDPPASPSERGEIVRMTISELAPLIRRGEVSPTEIARAYLERAERLNPTLGAYITIMADEAMADARRAESEIAAGAYRGPLHGVPVAAKDIIYTKGTLTSAGSRALADHVPDCDSTIIERLRDAGAILLGKLNLSEFAMGGTIEHPYGTPRNPWNLDRSAGGSSSGSAVAAAGGLCAGALGSDTGGSIRGPSAFCGIVGLRPTYGRVTRHGVVPMSWSLDTVGPMARGVEDCAMMLRAIAGRDERDPTSAAAPVPDYLADARDDLRGTAIALPREMMDYEGLDDETRDAVFAAVGRLSELGAEVREVSLPMSARSGAAFLATADADCAEFHLDRLRASPNLYDRNTRTRLTAAALIPAPTYLRGLRARALIRDELADALSRCDAVAMPASPTPAPPIAQSTGSAGGYYEGRRDLERRRYTSPAALAGLPAISVPCGFTEGGLPIGLQLIGSPFAEGALMGAARAYERSAGWETSAPDG